VELKTNLPQFTPRQYTPPPHPTTLYLLLYTPTSRAPDPTHAPSMKFWFISVPQIFLSESCGFVSCSVCLQSVNPQSWHFTNNSLGLPLAYSLSVCLFLWICVVCVCFLLYLSFYMCCERCVVCGYFCIQNHLFVLFLLSLWIWYIPVVRCSWYMYDPAHMSVLLFYLNVYYSHSCVCVSKHVYVPASCLCCDLLSIYTHVFVLSSFSETQ